LALSPPLFPRTSLPRLAFARLATPSRPCYRRLVLQFAVGENSSTRYGPFLHSLHLRERLPSQPHPRLPIVSTVIGSTPPLPPSGLVPLLSWSYNPLTQLAPYCPFSLRRPRDFFTVPPLGYAQSSYCTASVADVNALGSRVMYATPQRFIVAPAPQLFFFHCRLLWVSLVVITIIYFVGVYGKGFPVDSYPCIYLYFSFRPSSRRGISYFAWQVCGWSHTRETWVDGFFHGAGLEKNRGWGSFVTIASAARSLCSQ